MNRRVPVLQLHKLNNHSLPQIPTIQLMKSSRIQSNSVFSSPRLSKVMKNQSSEQSPAFLSMMMEALSESDDIKDVGRQIVKNLDNQQEQKIIKQIQDDTTQLNQWLNLLNNMNSKIEILEARISQVNKLSIKCLNSWYLQ
ncbi:Hypothetical_protein [Hexamita inflata]|uniref:Hypothetical_protein n=1 Tax=Hexamita inflata TaxID=28002 RepID=A0AA86P3X3_9EUKA|nr:Hypothetical protein HINF_LOCUS17619 [Hexamita inflata]